jgi:probable HAF family extracellular repeat protein
MAISKRICTIRTAVLFVATLATIAPTHYAQAASLNTVGFVPFQQSMFANGVSADGNVVIGYLLAGGPTEALSWTAGTITDLGFLPPPYDGASQGTAANSDGSILAGYSGLYARPDEAFRWVGGIMTGLGFLGGGSSSNAYGISADGSVIVGIATSTAFGNGEAFRWVNGTMTSLGCLTVLNNAQQFQCGATAVSADGSVVVGNSSDSGSLLNHAFRWVGGTMTFLPNPCPSCLITAAAVNSDGTVLVGEARFVQNGPVTAYRWVNGKIHALGQLPGGNSSTALAVSADGSVVVGQGGGGNGEAFIWTAATGMQTLSAVLAAAGVDLTGWGLNQATGISADGTVVVGTGTFGNQDTGWIAVLVAQDFALSVSTTGSGTVTSSPAGINCGATCSASFGTGAEVSLTQTAASGSAFAGWGGACSGVGTCIVTMSQAQNVSANFVQGSPPSSPLVAAVLPESRSALVNNTVTAFATIINTGGSTAPQCAIAPSGGEPINFVYQTTNPQTNALTGTANTPVDIAAGQPQSFVIALTPTAAFNPVQVPFSFACNNVVPAPSVTGLNTLLLSASTTPVPDIIALVATASNDGILHIPAGSNSFAVATVNLGSSSTVTVTANTGSTTLPLALALCQTNSASGQCISAIGSSVSTTINANDTPTFGIFATASGAIPFDPVNNRIFVQFTDGTNAVRGATSVAVETQ